MNRWGGGYDGSMSQDFIGIVDNEYESELTSSIRYDIQKFFQGPWGGF